MLCPEKKTQVMGILNVTPDSFSDGGEFVSTESISIQIEKMVAAGVDIIDVGGESTRPFAQTVTVEEELERVLTGISIIREKHEVPISIDTTKAIVARKAIEAGANIINDVSALRFDQEMISLLRNTSVPVIIMHMLGTPKTMQVEPVYDDVVTEIIEFLDERLRWATEKGVARDRFIVDPGIGFGKTLEHNLSILNRLQEFQKLNCPILIGHSRKSFIGKVLGLDDPKEREIATAVISGWCTSNGVSILRVHDVGKTVQAVRITEAIKKV